MFLSVLFLGLPFAKGLTFQHSAAFSVAEVSRARCVEIPESCADGVDEMIETATTIKQEVREELNATRARFHSIALDFVRCNTLTSQVSSYTSKFRAKAESHTSCRVRQKADFDASKSCMTLLTAVKANRTILCERESLTTSPTDLVSLCKANSRGRIGHVAGRHEPNFPCEVHAVEERP